MRSGRTLPPDYALMRRLRVMSLNDNALNGTLPDSWAVSNSFPGMLAANLVSCRELPVAFTLSLACLTLFPTQAANYLSGSIPASWFTQGPFPRLDLLSLAGNKFTGSFPPVSPDCTLCRPKVGS